MRRAVWRCLGGASRSDAKISSITPVNGPSLGSARGIRDRYPGGSPCPRILSSVLQPSLYSRQTSRFETPSTSTLRRISDHSSMSVRTLLPFARRTPPRKPQGARTSRRGSSGAVVFDDHKPIMGAVVFEERLHGDKYRSADGYRRQALVHWHSPPFQRLARNCRGDRTGVVDRVAAIRVSVNVQPQLASPLQVRV